MADFVDNRNSGSDIGTFSRQIGGTPIGIGKGLVLKINQAFLEGRLGEADTPQTGRIRKILPGSLGGLIWGIKRVIQRKRSFPVNFQGDLQTIGYSAEFGSRSDQSFRQG